MAWKPVEQKIVRCTKNLASEFASMEPAPGDRRVRDRLSGKLARAMEDGTFRVANFASVKCKETKKEYRLNGKHTSKALVALNGNFPKGLMAFVERYEAETLRDVSAIYATYDPNASARSPGDVNTSFAATDKDLADISHTVINSVVAAIHCAKHGVSGTPVSRMMNPEERAVEMFNHKEFVFFVDNLIGADPRYRPLRRSPVLGAIFLTWQKDPKDAETFWTMVRDGSGPDHTAPDRLLYKYLLETYLHSSVSKNRKIDPIRAMFVRCIRAWNAWRKQEPADLRYYEKSEAPEAV